MGSPPHCWGACFLPLRLLVSVVGDGPSWPRNLRRGNPQTQEVVSDAGKCSVPPPRVRASVASEAEWPEPLPCGHEGEALMRFCKFHVLEGGRVPPQPCAVEGSMLAKNPQYDRGSVET